MTMYETIMHTHVLWISFRASCASSGDLEPVTKTEQPLAARSLAVDRPIPLVDPVIRAVLPATDIPTACFCIN